MWLCRGGATPIFWIWLINDRSRFSSVDSPNIFDLYLSPFYSCSLLWIVSLVALPLRSLYSSLPLIRPINHIDDSSRSFLHLFGIRASFLGILSYWTPHGKSTIWPWLWLTLTTSRFNFKAFEYQVKLQQLRVSFWRDLFEFGDAWQCPHYSKFARGSCFFSIQLQIINNTGSLIAWSLQITHRCTRFGNPIWWFCDKKPLRNPLLIKLEPMPDNMGTLSDLSRFLISSNMALYTNPLYSWSYRCMYVSWVM